MSILSDELTNDPLSRGYSGMTDAQCAASLNAVDRPTNREPGALLEYLLMNRYRSNEGTDTTLSAIWGRLESLANASILDDVFGRAVQCTHVQVHAARTIVQLAKSDHISLIDFADTELDAALSAVAGGATGAKAMAPGDVTAIKALGDNRQSRAQEIGFHKKVFPIDVLEARG